MDSNKGRSKAVLRSLMKDAATRKEKKIDSPLVRYNDIGQAVCKICNIVIKSEGLWTAHLVSKAHKEAVEDFKRRSKISTSNVAKKSMEVSKESVSKKVVLKEDSQENNVNIARPASVLPEGFFDTPVSKQPRTDSKSNMVEKKKAVSETVSTQPRVLLETKTKTETISSNISESPSEKKSTGKSSLPEGFFDSKAADHKARGVELPKLDIKEELKEFQMAVNEELEEVDIRQLEDEADAADEREMREASTQRSLLERVEALRSKKEERALALAQAKKNEGKGSVKEVEVEEEDEVDEEDDDDDGVFGLLDWRAKHF